jgi:hypothetical protein
MAPKTLGSVSFLLSPTSCCKGQRRESRGLNGAHGFAGQRGCGGGRGAAQLCWRLEDGRPRPGRRPPGGLLLGARHSPPPSPRRNIPASCGRWPALRAPAPTPSSLLLLLVVLLLAGNAAVRSLASAPAAATVTFAPGSQCRAVQAAADRARPGTRWGREPARGTPAACACSGLSTQKSITTSSLTRGRTRSSPGLALPLATTASHARRGAKTPGSGRGALWVL